MAPCSARSTLYLLRFGHEIDGREKRLPEAYNEERQFIPFMEEMRIKFLLLNLALDGLQ